MITLEELKEMEPNTIFADGLAVDSPIGINMTNSGQNLRWIAIRGGIWDWAIYCHTADKSLEWIKKSGDKVHNENTVKKLVPCDKEAFEMYRH